MENDLKNRAAILQELQRYKKRYARAERRLHLAKEALATIRQESTVDESTEAKEKDHGTEKQEEPSPSLNSQLPDH